jgi:hypothetical protein
MQADLQQSLFAVQFLFETAEGLFHDFAFFSLTSVINKFAVPEPSNQRWRKPAHNLRTIQAALAARTPKPTSRLTNPALTRIAE